MENLVNSARAHYRERMERIILFDPLNALSRKMKKDKGGQPIDYHGLGLLTLLFFFENMLVRNKKTGTTELAHFLQTLTQKEMDLSPKDYQGLAREIIDTFRPPGGKKPSRVFYNWETRQNDEIMYSILKTGESDSAQNKQYYTLDEQGLELVFATKEFFSEFQLSINQLILRKQLEKGEFVGALRQIDEMRINVETLRERMDSIDSEIQRSIVSDQTYERYKNILEDITIRLNREHEEFEELKAFVQLTLKRLGYDYSDEKGKKTYELILKIDFQLGGVHDLHNQLLTESIDLKNTALEAARESLYYTGIQSFNIEHEIVQKIVSTPLPVDICKTIVNPFLKVAQVETWSPLAIFAPQRIERNEEVQKTRTFAQLEEEEKEENTYLLSQNFAYIMEKIIEALNALNRKQKISLLEVSHYLETNEPDLLGHRAFYDFWLIGHHYSPMKRENTEMVFSKAFSKLPKDIEEFTIIELKTIHKMTPRYTIQNMELSLGGEANV